MMKVRNFYSAFSRPRETEVRVEQLHCSEDIRLRLELSEIRVDEGESGEGVCRYVVEDVAAVLVDLGVLDGLQPELVVEVLRLPRVRLQRQ